MKENIYKDHYDFEWSHRAYLTSSLSVPIGAATLIVGAVGYLAKNFKHTEPISSFIFYAAIIFCVLTVFYIIYCLLRSAHGYFYERIATPKKLKEHYDDLLAWRLRNNGTVEDAENDFIEDYKSRLAEAVEVNSKNNREKSAWLYNAYKGLIISLFFLVVAGVPFTIYSDNEEKVVKVRIIN